MIEALSRMVHLRARLGFDRWREFLAAGRRAERAAAARRMQRCWWRRVAAVELSERRRFRRQQRALYARYLYDRLCRARAVQKHWRGFAGRKAARLYTSCVVVQRWWRQRWHQF